MGPRIALRAPNHLGDGVMALPLVEALAAAVGGRLTVHAPGWGPDLYGPLGVRLEPARTRMVGDVALLCPPSPRTVWEARGVRRRVGVQRWGVHERIDDSGHQQEVYRRLGAAVDVDVDGAPTWRGAPRGGPSLPVGHLALNPLSATPATREWSGFAALAAAWEGPVVAYGGPGEEGRLHNAVPGWPAAHGLSLPALAHAWSRAAVVVSVDTGPAHFARSLGIPTVVVHGGTAPERSGATGSLAVEGYAPCRPCHRSTCRPHGCAPRACLDIPVASVLAAARRIAR